MTSTEKELFPDTKVVLGFMISGILSFAVATLPSEANFVTHPK